MDNLFILVLYSYGKFGCTDINSKYWRAVSICDNVLAGLTEISTLKGMMWLRRNLRYYPGLAQRVDDPYGVFPLARPTPQTS